MNFSLTSDQIALRDAVARACEGELAWNAADDKRAWQVYGELGLLQLAVPEHSGGSGLGMAEVMLIAQVLGQEARGMDWIRDSLALSQIPARYPDVPNQKSTGTLVEDCGNAALCALMAGASGRLLMLTRNHLLMRKQFGSALAKFQVLQHRLADMAIDLEQCCAMSCLAAMVCEFDGAVEAQERQRKVSAAKAICSDASRRTAYAAIQLHGATGITDARIGALVRLILRSEKLWGDRHEHLSRMETLEI